MWRTGLWASSILSLASLLSTSPTLAIIGKLPGVVDLNQALLLRAQMAPCLCSYFPLSRSDQLPLELLRLDVPRVANNSDRAQLPWPRVCGGLHLFACLDDLSSNWLPSSPRTAPIRAGTCHGDEDIRHRFTLSVTYSLPRKNQVPTSGSWQLNTIITCSPDSRGTSTIRTITSVESTRAPTAGISSAIQPTSSPSARAVFLALVRAALAPRGHSRRVHNRRHIACVSTLNALNAGLLLHGPQLHPDPDALASLATWAAHLPRYRFPQRRLSVAKNP